ncbi:uncharacterized protein LOC144138487 [Haemaphysalis longicornis]
MLPVRPIPLTPVTAAAVMASEVLGSALPRQVVYVFPPLNHFDPNCLRLVTESNDAETAVACLLGFFKVVCEQGYQEVVRGSDQDGVWLDEVHVSGAFVRRQLRALGVEGQPPATRDDFYLLLSVMLCNLPRARGSNLNRDWFEHRVADLLEFFPGVSAPPKIPLYGQEQAEAISHFGEQWPHTRAALCNALLKGAFQGPMEQVQEYVAVGWRFAGMKHVHLILEFLKGRNSWVLDIIPELRAQGDRLQAFLKAYQQLGEDGPYMKLLHLPEAATSLRKHLGLHVAAAYALAVLEDDNWLQYKGVPRGEGEEHVFAKISEIKRMAQGAPPKPLAAPAPAGAEQQQEQEVRDDGLPPPPQPAVAAAPRHNEERERVDVGAAGEPAAASLCAAP